MKPKKAKIQSGKFGTKTRQTMMVIAVATSQPPMAMNSGMSPRPFGGANENFRSALTRLASRTDLITSMMPMMATAMLMPIPTESQKSMSTLSLVTRASEPLR